MQQQQIPTSYPIVVSQAPLSEPVIINAAPRQLKVNAKSTRGLAIANLTIGLFSIILGIAVIIIGRRYHDFKDYGWSGIVGIFVGIWVGVAGILGFRSSTLVNNACFNWTSMSFNIVTCVFTFITAFIYGIIVGSNLSNCRRHYYNWNYRYSYWKCDDRDAAKGCLITLLVLHVIGFFIALTASILCCTAGCSTCCTNQTPPTVVYQHPPYIATSSAPMYVASSGVPISSVHYPVSQSVHHPVSQPLYQNTTAVTQSTMGHTNVTYSTEQPPQYQEKQNPAI